MPIYLPNGIGETTGDTLATVKPLQLSGNVWYCDYINGVDAVSPRGQNRERPLKTLTQAVTNAADNDIIVLLASETIATTVTLSKRLAICGSGTSDGRPVVKLIPAVAASAMLNVTVANVELRNLWLDENTSTNAVARVTVGAVAGFRAIDCYVECGATDTGPALEFAASASFAELAGSTFISTGTSAAAQPDTAVQFAGVATDITVSNCVFSGGTVGFSRYYALNNSAGAISRLRAWNVSLLLGADWKLHASTTGFVNIGVSTGGARNDW